MFWRNIRLPCWKCLCCFYWEAGNDRESISVTWFFIVYFVVSFKFELVRFGFAPGVFFTPGVLVIQAIVFLFVRVVVCQFSRSFFPKCCKATEVFCSWMLTRRVFIKSLIKFLIKFWRRHLSGCRSRRRALWCEHCVIGCACLPWTWFGSWEWLHYGGQVPVVQTIIFFLTGSSPGSWLSPQSSSSDSSSSDSWTPCFKSSFLCLSMASSICLSWAHSWSVFSCSSSESLGCRSVICLQHLDWQRTRLCSLCRHRLTCLLLLRWRICWSSISGSS